MNEAQFLALMDQPESVSLDFKREPWQLSTEDGKSKFIKDVVCMANADRGDAAYILVGVQAPVGGTRTVVEVTLHPDDATLQQIIKDKVDPVPAFLYQSLTAGGKSVGVVSIGPSFVRPHVITKDYGILRRQHVYIRRGSSCDEARPDEIESMYRGRFAAQQVQTGEVEDSGADDVHDLLVSAVQPSSQVSEIIARCLPIAERLRMLTWHRWLEIQLTGIDAKEGLSLAAHFGVSPEDPLMALLASRRRVVYLNIRAGLEASSIELPWLVPMSVAQLEGQLQEMRDGIARGGVPAASTTISAGLIPGLAGALNVDQHRRVPLEVPLASLEGALDGIRKQVVEFLLEARRVSAQAR